MTDASHHDDIMDNSNATLHYTVHEDNNDTVIIAREPRIRPWTKHINQKYWHFVTFLRNGIMSINWISTVHQLVDILNKPLRSEDFHRFTQEVCGWSFPTSQSTWEVVLDFSCIMTNFIHVNNYQTRQEPNWILKANTDCVYNSLNVHTIQTSAFKLVDDATTNTCYTPFIQLYFICTQHKYRATKANTSCGLLSKIKILRTNEILLYKRSIARVCCCVIN